MDKTRHAHKRHRRRRQRQAGTRPRNPEARKGSNRQLGPGLPQRRNQRSRNQRPNNPKRHPRRHRPNRHRQKTRTTKPRRNHSIRLNRPGNTGYLGSNNDLQKTHLRRNAKSKTGNVRVLLTNITIDPYPHSNTQRSGGQPKQKIFSPKRYRGPLILPDL